MRDYLRDLLAPYYRCRGGGRRRVGLGSGAARAPRSDPQRRDDAATQWFRAAGSSACRCCDARCARGAAVGARRRGGAHRGPRLRRGRLPDQAVLGTRTARAARRAARVASHAQRGRRGISLAHLTVRDTAQRGATGRVPGRCRLSHPRGQPDGAGHVRRHPRSRRQRLRRRDPPPLAASFCRRDRAAVSAHAGHR